MKTRIITLVTFLLLSFAGNAQIDRSKQPEPGPSPKIKLGKAETFTLKNGLKVIMVENHKLPRVFGLNISEEVLPVDVCWGGDRSLHNW